MRTGPQGFLRTENITKKERPDARAASMKKLDKVMLGISNMSGWPRALLFRSGYSSKTTIAHQRGETLNNPHFCRNG